jgi:hypothetical protein
MDILSVNMLYNNLESLNYCKIFIPVSVIYIWSQVTSIISFGLCKYNNSHFSVKHGRVLHCAVTSHVYPFTNYISTASQSNLRFMVFLDTPIVKTSTTITRIFSLKEPPFTTVRHIYSQASCIPSSHGTPSF